MNLRNNINDICDIAGKEFENDSEYLKTFAMIATLSYDIYVKKQIIEHLLDSICDDELSKQEIKELKEKAKQKEREAKELAKQHKHSDNK